jgi:mannose-1-phosphate guanylyltransferase/phosphomannomutase
MSAPIIQVAILAGGKGTRMGDLTARLPKPMLPLHGKPILEHQIELARRYGCTEVILLVGCLGEVIRDYFGDGSRWGVSIRYHHELSPLGTAGALKAIEDWLDDTCFVFYGDTVMDVDLQALAAFHQERRPLATLLVHPNDHPYDSDLVELDRDGRIAAFHGKPRTADRHYSNCASAAMYVVSRGLLDHIRQGESADLGRDVFPRVVRDGGLLLGYNTAEYIKDVGTPERLAQVARDVESGKVARLNRGCPREAIFLDRDGVINREVDHVVKTEQFELLPGAAEAIRRINRSEYLAVVVTNQPAIAKGWLAENELRRIHDKMESLLGESHAFVDRIYYCPHHPDKGFDGEVSEYKVPCECRKPRPGMLLAAKNDLNIDMQRSWMIGDSTADIAAGAHAGCRTILLRTGHGGQDGKYAVRPDHVSESLSDAVGRVLADDAGPAGPSLAFSSEPSERDPSLLRDDR